jgi:hypothetical protein
MPKRLHSVSPARRQQDAIHEESQQIRNDPGNETRNDDTANVDFSHTFSFSNHGGETAKSTCFQHSLNWLPSGGLASIPKPLRTGKGIFAKS